MKRHVGVDTNSNHTKKDVSNKITWAVLHALSPKYAVMGQILASEYGYAIDPEEVIHIADEGPSTHFL